MYFAMYLQPYYRWQTACALHLSVSQGLSIDLLVMHPNETGVSIAMGEQGQVMLVYTASNLLTMLTKCVHSPNSETGLERPLPGRLRGMLPSQTRTFAYYLVQICRDLSELQFALRKCSPAPKGLKDFLPGERRLTGTRTDILMEALSSNSVWLLHDPATGEPVGVLARGLSHTGMVYGSIVASSSSALEGALRLARVCIPHACRFYFLAACPPLSLMRDQVSSTAIWTRSGSGPPETPLVPSP